MATLAQIETFVLGDPTFKRKFQSARIQAAWDILVEASPSAQRVAWRDKILENPFADLDREYHLFLGNASVQGTSGASAGTVTDATVLSVTKGLVDTFAVLT
jgi:hypothetical protein